MTTITRQQKGFTLIELSLVIIIVGLLVIPLLQLYKLYMVKEEILKTEANISGAASAIGRFVLRYPCPSDRSLSPGDPNYGVEQCTGIPNCNATGTQGICRGVGNRDTDGDGTFDPILIGGIPYMYYKSYTSPPLSPVLLTPSGDPNTGLIARMQASYMVDGWGNKMTYAVTESLTNPLKADTNSDFRQGVIGAQSEHNRPTAGVNDDAQFVILSHGKDRIGSFSLNGVNTPCTAGMVESENCNNDGTFRQALGAYEGTTADYYDDITYFYTKSSGDLWYSLVDAANRTSPHINNLNKNFIGINTDTPQARLDVAGNINADTVRAKEVCNADGTKCFSPTLLGDGIPTQNNTSICPNGMIISEIGNSKATCSFPSLNTGINGTAECNAGFFITSIETNGCIICNDGVTKCP